jgi:hypothetical protein
MGLEVSSPAIHTQKNKSSNVAEMTFGLQKFRKDSFKININKIPIECHYTMVNRLQNCMTVKWPVNM